MVKGEAVNPKALGPAVGYAHGMRVGEFLFVAGQIGGTPKGDGTWKMEKTMGKQFAKAVENVLEVIRIAGGGPQDVVEMTAFITDMVAYKKARKEIGVAWRKHLGSHYPAMTLVQVAKLYEPGAKVEIKAVAHLG